MFNIKETFKKDDNSTINDLIIGYIKCVLIKSQICYMSILMIVSNQALNVIYYPCIFDVIKEEKNASKKKNSLNNYLAMEKYD